MKTSDTNEEEEESNYLRYRVAVLMTRYIVQGGGWIAFDYQSDALY